MPFSVPRRLALSGRMVALATALLFNVQAKADSFAKITGIPGDATASVDGLAGEGAAGTGLIDILSWSWGASYPLGADAPIAQPVVVTKKLDSATAPLLREATLNGGPTSTELPFGVGNIAEVVLVNTTFINGEFRPTVEWKLKGVTVVSVASGTDADDEGAPTEAVTFRYKCLEIKHIDRDLGNGGSRGTVPGGHNFSEPCS